MRESVIYQEILEEGRQEGWQEGRQEGERSLVLKQLMRRVGVLSEEARSQIFGAVGGIGSGAPRFWDSCGVGGLAASDGVRVILGTVGSYRMKPG